MLPRTEILRYKKHIMLPEIGIVGQEKIRDAKVLVVGAGGLGTAILPYLAAAGVGTIGIVDFDKIELDNLHRQILYGEKDICQKKIELAIKSLQTKHSTVTFIGHDIKLDGANAVSIIQGYDIVLDASDNFATRYLVNDTCVLLERTFVFGSVLNFQGQIAVFNHQGSKHLRDLFPLPPPPEDVPNCNDNGVIGTLPGIVGTMMAHEALKLIVGIPSLDNQFLIIDTLRMDFQKINF
ncbi:HesA/MoeB/ThiF family protein [Sphingobacterium sp. SYP-B4668]|uniref:HesA/MoeB/ThiF family protein n=1 Tax=Sphingobacterium sp. SYP-B4668 TaxID=2996035 RepID=UPI0022DCFBB4|nr:HesA/MoeB/ThiF family protein [Sphingobacterium sp. SYP-B4668]